MIEYSDLSVQQRKAVDSCVASINSGAKLTYLAGYAGTGKTTVAGIIASRTELSPRYSAYTGKAASVLRQKGYPATTIHRLTQRFTGERKRNGRTELEFRLDEEKTRDLTSFLLVIDETSMIGQKLGNDIMSIGCPVLAIGDPAQLGPVNDIAFFNGEPDAFLTRVERHTGTILDLAHDIRKNGTRVIWKYQNVLTSYVDENEAPDYSQIVVWTNKARDDKNLRIRALRGFADAPVNIGEKIICLANNYRIGVVNGQMFTITDFDEWRESWMMTLNCECAGIDDDVCDTCGWDCVRAIRVWRDGFYGLDNRDWRGVLATYGHVITVHKAQGSEWDSVLVTDLNLSDPRWMYTAVTRAKESLTIYNPKHRTSPVAYR